MTGPVATNDIPVTTHQDKPAPEAVSLSQQANALLQPIDTGAKVAGDAPGASAPAGTGGRAQELAEDIQKNVGAALSNPSDQGALDALHQDAIELNGNLDKNMARTTNQALQDSVQAELRKLEANGTLPSVTISEAGEISAEIKTGPPVSDPMDQPRGAPGQNGRGVIAGPDQASKVWDF